MFQIALYEPEIPPNTGNIIRLCANTGCQLHLIHPLGFSMETKQLRRAGLDYRDLTHVTEHLSWDHFVEAHPNNRILAFSTKAKSLYTDTSYKAGDILLFGPETRGLPNTLMDKLPSEQILKMPMLPASRSLNLSNTVAIAAYEALRQTNFSQML
ncbi:MAG: tRNA (uridine(34)/cytosine(34)/5-carboxymethylaminomethyluridine(34)-2'-O)-methyltransferase TrmL [Leucothrix sp.]